MEARYCNLLDNKWIDTKQIFSIKTPMTAVGVMVWLILLAILFAVLKNKGKFVVPLTPCVGVLVTLLIATPSGYWPRYLLVSYYIFPVVMCMIPAIGKANVQDS